MAPIKRRRSLLPAEERALRERLEAETRLAFENIEMLVRRAHGYEGETVDLVTLEGSYIDIGSLIRAGREGVQ
jgi:hypothetical protein